MKTNIKNISVILGGILVAGIIGWYATSEISANKEAKIKTERVCKNLTRQLTSVSKERDTLQRKLDQLDKELVATEEIKERNNILYVMECVKVDKIEQANKNLQDQLVDTVVELEETLRTLIRNNRETLKGYSEKIDDIRYKAVDEKWSTDKAVRMMASEFHDGNITLLENGTNMLTAIENADDKIKDALSEATSSLERFNSIYNEQRDEALKDPAAYWSKMEEKDKEKVESEDK